MWGLYVCMHDIVHVVNRKPTGHRGIVIFLVTQSEPDIIDVRIQIRGKLLLFL